MNENDIKILGLTDEITTCGCCGKTGLKVTVALEINGGPTLYYGRDCAGMIRYGKKSSNNTRKVAEDARSEMGRAARAARRAAHLATPEGQAEQAAQDAMVAASDKWLAANPGKILMDYFSAVRDAARAARDAA